MEFFFLLLGAIFVVAIVIYGVISLANADADNEPPPQLSQEARVIGKRQHVSDNYSGISITYYYVAFEMSDRSRIEYSVDGYDYGLMIEGDVGILQSQGESFQGFDRQLDQQ
jgi:hypothetical protein